MGVKLNRAVIVLMIVLLGIITIGRKVSASGTNVDHYEDYNQTNVSHVKSESQLIAAPLGANVTLVCNVEAAPKPVLSWFNKEGQLILNSVGKVRQETEIVEDNFLHMKLSISYLQTEDFRKYKCAAGNSLGSNYALIKLQQLFVPTATTLRPEMTKNTHVDTSGTAAKSYSRLLSFFLMVTFFHFFNFSCINNLLFQFV